MSNLRTRFIPACAGNRLVSRLRNNRLAVHPRVCGEQLRPKRRIHTRSGSSPRVRGTVKHSQGQHLLKRFIPACAGNSNRIEPRFHRYAVHPHVCGEQHAGRNTRANDGGSSPRVRGTESSIVLIQQRLRFIPACAGNSTTQHVNGLTETVHPRVCGEQLHPSTSLTPYPGSSPRVRGTECLTTLCGHYHRFIPACAGNRRRDQRRPS